MVQLFISQLRDHTMSPEVPTLGHQRGFRQHNSFTQRFTDQLHMHQELSMTNKTGRGGGYFPPPPLSNSC